MEINYIIKDFTTQMSGPSYLVRKYAEEIINRGHLSTIISVGATPGNWNSNVRLQVFNSFWDKRIWLSVSFVKEILKLSSKPCIVHGNGVWRLPNLYPLFSVKNRNAKFMCSPHGSLSHWSMTTRRLMKYPFWIAAQKPALMRIDCFHATSESELIDIRNLGFRQPISLVPAGIEVPQSQGENRKKTVIYLGRLHPIKGLENLLNAWARIELRFDDWDLKIAGPVDDDYAQTLLDLARKLKLQRCHFVGAVQDEAKASFLKTSSLLVLPSYSENFGLAVAEALASAVPVITTTGTPWSRLVDMNCGWYVAPTVDDLTGAIANALAASTPLLSMGVEGRRWMESEYSWQKISGQMLQTYQWLAGDSPQPNHVYTI